MTINQFARFCKRFVIPTDNEEISHRVCWLWIGTRQKGYGSVVLNKKKEPAHRAMYEHCYGKIADELVVHHKCHNRLCVNPFHLEAISRGNNTKEANEYRWNKNLVGQLTDEDLDALIKGLKNE